MMNYFRDDISDNGVYQKLLLAVTETVIES